MRQAPTPTNVTELKAYLLSTVLAPLYELLQKDKTWTWQTTQAETFQKCKDMSTHPIHSKPEQNYSQLEKEGLALIFGVQKFLFYLYGQHFTMYADHKPLQTSSEIDFNHGFTEYWALTLAMYDYTIKYHSGNSNSNADALSRLPMPDAPDVLLQCPLK